METDVPLAECFPGPDDVPNWETCDFCMGMGSCIHYMTCKKHQGSHAEIAYLRTPLFCMKCVLVMGECEKNFKILQALIYHDFQDPEVTLVKHFVVHLWYKSKNLWHQSVFQDCNGVSLDERGYLYNSLSGRFLGPYQPSGRGGGRGRGA